MSGESLKIFNRVELDNPTMIIGFSGWMNGGEVSSGSIECIVEKLGVKSVAEIENKDFYIYNFPGTMEITSLFRPHCIIEDGIIIEYDEPANIFWVNQEYDIVFFMGQEPNLNWSEYVNCIFRFCREFNVGQIYSIGSVAGLVPHTREPRYICTVSDVQAKKQLDKYGFKFTNYNGPSSIINTLLVNAVRNNISMTSIVAEIPAYVHGRNPKCIDSAARTISGLLGLRLEFPELRSLGEELEKKLNEIIASRTELGTHILKLEEDYDNEVFDTEMGDLKDWLHKQGIRLD